MTNPRLYGRPPYQVAVIHGGPGAPGEMAPVARELAPAWSVLEPLQTADTLDGQVEELRGLLDQHASDPVVLIGFSWGAMLGTILAARSPERVRKLILVSSAVFEDRYAGEITRTRLARLGEDERQEAIALTADLHDPVVTDRNWILARLGVLYTKADLYDPLTLDTEVIDVQAEINQRVWAEAARLRSSGELLGVVQSIRCPVAAIHGEYDSHPAAGVREPLSRVLADFEFVLLQKCGHYPWLERHARDEFFRVLKREIGA